jgi:hypothetical protein
MPACQKPQQDRDGKDREQVQARQRHRVHGVLQSSDHERDRGDRQRASHEPGRRTADCGVRGTAVSAQLGRSQQSESPRAQRGAQRPDSLRATAGASGTASERRRPRAPAQLR